MRDVSSSHPAKEAAAALGRGEAVGLVGAGLWLGSPSRGLGRSPSRPGPEIPVILSSPFPIRPQILRWPRRQPVGSHQDQAYFQLEDCP